MTREVIAYVIIGVIIAFSLPGAISFLRRRRRKKLRRRGIKRYDL